MSVIESSAKANGCNSAVWYWNKINKKSKEEFKKLYLGIILDIFLGKYGQKIQINCHYDAISSTTDLILKSMGFKKTHFFYG